MTGATVEGAVRLNRYLAMCGVAARRKADDLIAAGRVTVNGETPPPGGRTVLPGRDRVAVDGRDVRPAVSHRYLMVNKPVGYLSAVSDRSRRPLVTSLVPARDREGLHPVGRLDLRSRGLVILTDDGELSFRLQHPRHHVAKSYAVSVLGHLDEADRARLNSGVMLDEGRATGVFEIEGAWEQGDVLRVVLHQGWKRQIRRTLQAVGHRVVDLRRTGIGPLALGDLAEGRSRPLTAGEVAALREAVGLGAGPAAHR